MAKESIQTEDFFIPHAASRAEQFLGVIQQQATEQGLGLSFIATRRGRRDPSIVLRSPVKVGRAADVEIEVFADPQGSALHVGWTANEKMADSWNNWGKDIQMIKQYGSNVGDAQHKLRGTLQAFHNLVFEPVTQMLVEATRQSQGPSGTGFLGS